MKWVFFDGMIHSRFHSRFTLDFYEGAEVCSGHFCGLELGGLSGLVRLKRALHQEEETNESCHYILKRHDVTTNLKLG